MSHHFDTKLAKEDPSLNICDFYLFEGAGDSTVMAMTVNPDVGLSAPDTFHIEGIYAFRFDLNGDSREEVAFKFRFTEPRHAAGDEHTHIQNFQLHHATGKASMHGLEGEMLLEGETGKVIHGKPGVQAYVGIVPDLFAGDAAALRSYFTAFAQGRFDGDAFQNRQNFFAKRNASAIVLEVPNDLIGQGKVHAWATVSLFGHAPEMLVSRWGLPLITHVFIRTNDELKEKYNATEPHDDVALFARPIAEFTEKMASFAGSVANPAEYGKQVAQRLCPIVLPYEIGTAAAFDLAGFNGRPLADDVMDVMITLSANKPLADGVAPDRSRMRSEFPYFGERFSKDEQVGVVPVPRPPKK